METTRRVKTTRRIDIELMCSEIEQFWKLRPELELNKVIENIINSNNSIKISEKKLRANILRLLNNERIKETNSVKD